MVLAILFQVGSGLVLLRRRTVSSADAFGTLQGMAGAYLAAFLASHLTAVFILGRWQGGIDTNWDWAIGNPTGLYADAWNVRLIPHYLIAVAAVVAHAGCGLRVVLLAHGVRESVASALAPAIISAGTLLAIAIWSECSVSISAIEPPRQDVDEVLQSRAVKLTRGRPTETLTR